MEPTCPELNGTEEPTAVHRSDKVETVGRDRRQGVVDAAAIGKNGDVEWRVA
jgi:hypothetical protein